MLKVHAHAKINLCLDVVKRREDGYHEMDMIMMPLCFHDTLWIEKAETMIYESNLPNLRFDASNTIVKAVALMKQTFHISDQFHIRLEKRIPMEAGLAGGSSNAAAVMRGLWEYYRLPCTLAQLAHLGKQIGADVPFCVMDTCALVQGIGEVITPFVNHCDFYVLLIKPQKGVSTKEAFQALDLTAAGHPDTAACMKALQEGDFDTFCAKSANTLEYSAFQLVEEIAAVKQTLLAYDLPFVLMSGSGSTVFALSQDKQQLIKIKERLAQRYPFVMLTEAYRQMDVADQK